MKNIMPFNVYGRCYICKAECHTDEHHIFEGANRSASDRYGLTVYLCRVCHRRAHEQPELFENKYKLKRRAQLSAMSKYGWSVDEFRTYFRKDYR